MVGITKHLSHSLFKFLDSLGKIWEYHADFLKNSETINTMDLNSLFGNMCNYEETKALRKDIMKDSNKEKFVALLSKNEISDYVSDSDVSDQDNTSNEYPDELVANNALIVTFYEESRLSSTKRFPFKGNSSARKNAHERKDEEKCFNCGSTNHFSREWIAKKDSQKH